MTKLLKRTIIGGYFLFLALGGVYVAITVRHDSRIMHPENGDGIVCTMDAKVCPDGSAVGRVPPSCEFSKCPDIPPAIQ